MKRPSSSRSKQASDGVPPSSRVLHCSPVVYLGPDALESLEKGRGLLLGMQRPGWVDVLFLEPVPGKRWRQIVDARFESGDDWEVVGVLLSRQEFERQPSLLARELVPGDVVLALGAEGTRAQAYVNLGDQWVPARLKISRSRRSTSTRPGHPRPYSRSSR